MHLPVSVSLYRTFHTFCNLYTLHSYIGCFQYIMFPWDFYQYESALSGHRSRNQVPIYSIQFTHRQNQSKSRSLVNKDMTKWRLGAHSAHRWSSSRINSRSRKEPTGVECGKTSPILEQCSHLLQGTYHTIAKGSELRSRSSIIWTPKLEIIIPRTLWW